MILQPSAKSWESYQKIRISIREILRVLLTDLFTQKTGPLSIFRILAFSYLSKSQREGKTCGYDFV